MTEQWENLFNDIKTNTITCKQLGSMPIEQILKCFVIIEMQFHIYAEISKGNKVNEPVLFTLDIAKYDNSLVEMNDSLNKLNNPICNKIRKIVQEFRKTMAIDEFTKIYKIAYKKN